MSLQLGAVHKLFRLRVEGGGVINFPILLSIKTTNREGGRQKFLISRRHSLLTAPFLLICIYNWLPWLHAYKTLEWAKQNLANGQIFQILSRNG